MSVDTDEIDLRAILAILQRQRRLLAATVVVVVGLALAYLLAAKPIYEATVLLQLDGRSSNLLDPSGSGQEQSAILNSRVDSEVEILRSQATALAVVQAADLVNDPEFGPQLGWMETLGLALGTDLDADALRRLVGLRPAPAPPAESLVNGTLRKLQSAVEARRRGLTYLIGISVSSESPQRAAEIANIYAATYIERQLAAKTNAMVTARDVLRRQIATAEADLASSEVAVNAFIESNLSRFEEESGDPGIADLRRRLNDAKEAQVRSSAQVLAAEAAISAGDWQTVADTLGDQALQALVRQRQDVQRRLGEAASGSILAPDLNADLARLDADLARASSVTLGSVRDGVAALRERERTARDDLRTQLLESDLSAEMLAELFNLQQSSTVARNQYQTLLAREQDLGALANLQLADARIVSEALPPNSASAPNKRLILALALLSGLGLGVLLAFLKEYFIGGIVSASQLGNVMQVAVPITVPVLEAGKTGGDPADSIVSSPMSSYAESFRKLRAAIDIGLSRRAGSGAEAERARVILVCSALPAEGKTTTAIALARTYALSNVRTLLIDADLRRPSIADRLDVVTSAGLVDFLTSTQPDTAPDLTAVAESATPLQVITAGERSNTPTDQLLNSVAFRALLDKARSNFEIVVIDSPPLLPVVDTRYLARYADAAVQVVRYGTTTQGEVREAASQMRNLLPPNAFYVGILNLEERAARGYGYYQNYGYYGQDGT